MHVVTMLEYRQWGQVSNITERKIPWKPSPHYMFHWAEKLSAKGIFYWDVLTLITPWISAYIHCNVWDEVTDSFPTLNGCLVCYTRNCQRLVY